MPNIASQIERIQNATKQLRNKGIDLELEVSKGVALNSNHRLDDVADAFDSIVVSKGETMPVELAVTKLKEDGTIAGNSYTLPTGYYKGLVIKPFFTQTSADYVLNIRTLLDYPITSKSNEIIPGSGFNYIDRITYTVQSGAINATPATYTNTYVRAKVGTAGWLDLNATKDITVPTATITSKVGSNAATTLSKADTETTAFTVSPNPGSDTVLTIAAGIYASPRTITVKSLASQMTDANATENDVLDKKIVYSNVGGVFQKVEGKMPNRGGTSSSVKSTSRAAVDASTGQIIVTPQLGYYNTYSRITTGLTVGPATYKQTATDLAETDHTFEVTPARDGDGAQTTYLTKVTIDNSYIYSLLAAI